MKFSVVGDIMLSRLVGAKYAETRYNILADDVRRKLNQSDYVIANLESPILDVDSEFDHLVQNTLGS